MSTHQHVDADVSALRVLHQIHLAHDAWGGMEKQFAALLRHRAADPRLAHYLSEDLRQVADGVAAALPGLSAPPVDTRRWHGVTVPNWRGMRQSRQASQARAWRIDTVLSWNRFGDPRPLRLARRIGAASVYWERGAAWFARNRAPDADFLHGFDCYLANSRACAAMLRYWGVTAPIHICAPGIAQARPGVARIAPQWPLRLGFAARLQSFKGGVLAVHTLAALRRSGVEATLTMAGDGPDRDSIQSQAQRLGIDDLRFTGRITDMDAFYQQIDLLLHPALREPYGNVVAEALIAGVPVVATAVDGVPDVIRDGVDGRCVEPTLPLSALASFGGDPDQVYPRVWRPELQRVAEPGVPDPAALAEAVLQVAGDDARYAAFSAAAVDGLRRFDYAAHVEQLIGYLQQAGASGHARQRRSSMRPYNCDDQQRPAWYDRADKAAQLIAALPAAGAGRTLSLADIGCGDQKLRASLVRHGVAIRYYGYDRVPQAEAVRPFDAEYDALPSDHDVAVLLGVGEYLDDVPGCLRRLRAGASVLVISHTLAEPPRSPAELQRLGWRLHVSGDEFEKMLIACGWQPDAHCMTDDGKTRIWACRRSATGIAG